MNNVLQWNSPKIQQEICQIDSNNTLQNLEMDNNKNCLYYTKQDDSNFLKEKQSDH